MRYVSTQILNKHCQGNNALGFGLIELMITMAAGSLIMLALANLVMGVHNASANIEVNSTFSNLINEVEFILKKPDICGKAFVDHSGIDTIQYNPPSGNPAYSVETSYLKLGTEVVLKPEGTPGPTPASYNRDLTIESFELSPKGGYLPTSTTYLDPASGISMPAYRHTVQATLTATRKRGSLSGQQVTRSWTIEVITAQSNDRVVKCNNPSFGNVYRAVAERAALALHSTRCTQHAPSMKYRANSCPDANGDGLCDNDTKKAAVDHPKYGTPEWDNWFPGRSSGTPPLGSASDEGRCLVDVDVNTSSEPHKEVFALYNSTSSSYKEGIGCRTENGWHLTGCFKSDDDTGAGGDSDILLLTTPTADYCVSNDHTQPHAEKSGGAFVTPKVALTVICMKFE